MIKAGELRDKITFERKTETFSSSGDISNEWETLITTFARVREKSGGYSYETGAINGQSRIEVMIRYRPQLPIQIGDRVQWRGFTWIINNSPVVDYLRTSITMQAVLQIPNSYRSSQEPVPPSTGFPYTLPLTLS